MARVSKRPRRLLVALHLALVTTCSDPTAPRLRVELDFCADDAPVFLAIRNEAGDWVAQAPDANATYTFDVTPRFALAYVRGTPASYTTNVMYASIGETASLLGVECVETLGSRTLSAAVAGMTAGNVAQIAMGAARAVTFGQGAFQVTGVVDAPTDIVATRVAPAGAGPLGVIVRRGVDLPDGATLPVFDFAAAEAVAPESHAVTISGLVPGENNRIDVSFRTARTTTFPFSLVTGFSDATRDAVMLPASRTTDTDWHTMDVLARAPGGGPHRGERQFFHVASDRSVALGPVMIEPTVELADAQRLRVTFGLQPQYMSFAQVRVEQPIPNARRVSVIATRENPGDVGDWVLEIPDLSGVEGFPTDAMLGIGRDAVWVVEAFTGSLAAHLGRLAAPATLKYAGRSGSIAIPFPPD